LVCPDCAKDLEDLFLTAPERKPESEII
jgi:hypothetical protein